MTNKVNGCRGFDLESEPTTTSNTYAIGGPMHMVKISYFRRYKVLYMQAIATVAVTAAGGLAKK
jgi:hypothetical protein